MSQFKLIAGLGNPGKRYQNTRHNVGFMLLDHVGASVLHSNPSEAAEPSFEPAGSFSWASKSGCEVAQVRLAGVQVTLIKPQSFMNLSGGPLGQILRFYKFPAEALIVVHDDIDLPLGVIRIKSGGGDGGHNGIRSIVEDLKTPAFVRLKIGVGRPGEKSAASQPWDGPGQGGSSVVEWVLGDFKKEEASELERVLSRAEAALAELCLSGVEIAQRKFNQALP